ncbi:MAG: ABC transporter permease [Lentisphaeraceae bacterium]|nr:ABC transporter permease [Lentisphaeraceae bacterium]
MKVHEIIVISFESLWSHPFRAVLAGLGVVFGVGAVIAMLSISEGAKQASLQQIEVLGVNKILLKSERPDETSTQAYSSIEFGLTKNDFKHFNTVLKNVNGVLPIRNTHLSLESKRDKEKVHLFACGIDLLEFTKSNIFQNQGRFFAELDNRQKAPVCVIGKNAARMLYDFENPLGKKIFLKGNSFEIIGILENPYSYSLAGGYDLNNLIFTTIGTAQAIWRDSIFNGSNFIETDYDFLYVRVKDEENIINTSNRIRKYLKETHPDGDVSIEVPFELLKQRQATQKIFSIVMASIASISLLVGGIGIMNIMLANIYERMREIGTRRALGATRSNILIQFLSESVLLTSCGGILGIVLGIGLAKLVELYGGMPTVISWVAIFISLFVSVFIGIVFGTFPAWKAAKLHPIEALRHE